MSERLRLAEPRFVADLVDDEVLAVDLTTGAYHHLRGWSALIWAHLARGATVDETLAAVAGDAPDATADHVRNFRDRLVEVGMFRPRDSDADDTIEIPTVPAEPWGELVIESHTDMADLILLDPVHEVDPDAGWPTRP